MVRNEQYRGVLKHRGRELYSTENNCPYKLLTKLSCMLEDDYHDAKALVINKLTGEIIYESQRASIG